MEEKPSFDGTKNNATNTADVAFASTENGGVLRVLYKGTANQRVLTRADLSGMPAEDGAALVFAPGTEVLWSWWVDLAGSEERARSVLSAQAHEFKLLGDGAADMPEAEEFDVGGKAE